MSEEPQDLTFHYIKTSQYRTVTIHGAYGGLTPNGNVYMAAFNERRPTPKSITYEVTQDGIGKELDRDSKEGIIREIECGLVMDIGTAIAVREWLDDKISAFEKRFNLSTTESGITEDNDDE